MKQLYDHIKSFYDFSDMPFKRIGTGIPKIDELIGGPAPGEICMILGRSYAGKSIVGQNIIRNNAQVPSIFFSLEMPDTQAVARLYAMWTNEPASDIQHRAEAGDLPEDIWDMAIAFSQHTIVDTPSITLDEMSSSLVDYDLTYKHRPEFVVVDYLELLGGAKATGEGYLKTEAQATKLKDWAKKESMRVFVLHQTNRHEPKWMPPTEDSARNAGYTEADFVVGMWRPHWNPEIKVDYYERLALQDRVCFNILKNRAYGQDIDEVRMRILPSLRIVE